MPSGRTLPPAIVRYRVTTALLRASEPLTIEEVVSETSLGRQAALGALFTLTDEGDVIEDHLVPEKPGPQYAWAGPRERVPPPEVPPDLESPFVRAFHRLVTRDYAPPDGKRFLVFFQCAVRRPFSKAPSHASMRRAVKVATGFDPARECDACPVHVVVLASHVGPVPYDLEDLYPANVRSDGVLRFGEDAWARARPILAARLAEYVSAHDDRYERIAGFGAGRYGEVMREAGRRAGREIAVFPEPAGPAVGRLGTAVPRSYWERYWIQLCLHIGGWLDASARGEIDVRLRKLGVEYEGSGP